MKSIKIARVKATGELLLVRACNDSIYKWRSDMHGGSGTLWREDQLEFQEDDPDYWTRLEHQAAIAAMQGLLNNNLLSSVLFKTGTTHVDYINEVVKVAEEYAHALVEKMKEEK